MPAEWERPLYYANKPASTIAAYPVQAKLTKNPAAGMLQTAGRFEIRVGEFLEDAQHNRTDKGESEICGNNAQSIDESHGKPRWFTSLPVVTLKASKPFQLEKVSAAVARHVTPAGDVVKKS